MYIYIYDIYIYIYIYIHIYLYAPVHIAVLAIRDGPLLVLLSRFSCILLVDLCL